MRTTPSELIATTAELATLPATVIKLLDLLKEPTVGVDEVLIILERDPAMTANLLKLANSAYYGMRRKITTVRRALVLLGNKAITMLTFATGMTPILRRDLDGYGIAKDDFWRHSLITAAASARVAQVRVTAAPGAAEYRSQAFTAGLVHDVGKLLIDTACVRHGRRLNCSGHRQGSRAAEIEMLGFDHCEAGAALAEQWGFPTDLSVPLRFHHDPAAALYHNHLVEAVAAGDLIAHYLEYVDRMGCDVGLDFPRELADLSITDQIVDEFRTALAGDLQKLLLASTDVV